MQSSKQEQAILSSIEKLSFSQRLLATMITDYVTFAQRLTIIGNRGPDSLVGRLSLSHSVFGQSFLYKSSLLCSLMIFQHGDAQGVHIYIH